MDSSVVVGASEVVGAAVVVGVTVVGVEEAVVSDEPKVGTTCESNGRAPLETKLFPRLLADRQPGVGSHLPPFQVPEFGLPPSWELKTLIDRAKPG